MAPPWIWTWADQGSSGAALLLLYGLASHLSLLKIRYRSHRGKSRNQALTRYHANLQVLPTLIKRVGIKLAVIRRVELISLVTAFTMKFDSFFLRKAGKKKSLTLPTQPYGPPHFCVPPLPIPNRDLRTASPGHDSQTPTRVDNILHIHHTHSTL